LPRFENNFSLFFGEGRFFIELPLLGGGLKGTLACPCFRAAEKLAIALALSFSGRRGRRPLRPPFSLSPIKRRSQHLLSPAKRLPPAAKKKSTPVPIKRESAFVSKIL
jgi:hypothetical protein